MTLPSASATAALRARVVQAADCVVRLGTFAGTALRGRANAYQHECISVLIAAPPRAAALMPEHARNDFVDFHGLLSLVKLPRRHSLAAPAKLDTVTFGIKRDKRSLRIERLHLPPEDSRSTRPADAAAAAPGLACAAPLGGSSDLDF